MEASKTAAVNDCAPSRVRTLLAALLFSLPAAPAWAEWRVIHAETGNFVEFDTATVREMPPFVMAWTRITFTETQTEAEQSYQSQGQLHAIDCDAHASTVVGVVNYSGAMGQGHAGERRTRPRAEWKAKPAPPKSLGALIIDMACRAAGKT